MSANTCARTGLFLLGAYLIVSSLANATGLFTQQPLIVKEGGSLPDFGMLAGDLVAGVVVVTVFGLVPGSWLIVKRERIADRWFPESDAQARLTLEPSTLYAIGLALLGAYFAIAGGASLLGGAFAALVVHEEPTEGIGGASLRTVVSAIGSGLVQLIAGAVLWYLGQRLARRAA
jgi:hypothetical protein